MELKSCILARTSSRSFETKNIPQETLIEILDSARYAPSPKNRQPWRFLILHGDGKRAIVENYQSEKSRSHEFEYLMSGEYYSENNSFDIIDQAPILILVFNAYPSKKTLPVYNLDFDMMNTQSIGAAVEHIMLRATDLGVSSLWLGDILSAEKFISASYPTMGKLTAGIVLGYSNAPCRKTDRLDFPEIIFDYKEIQHG